jgi:hypothetical protein
MHARTHIHNAISQYEVPVGASTAATVGATVAATVGAIVAPINTIPVNQKKPRLHKWHECDVIVFC